MVEERVDSFSQCQDIREAMNILSRQFLCKIYSSKELHDRPNSGGMSLFLGSSGLRSGNRW